MWYLWFSDSVVKELCAISIATESYEKIVTFIYFRPRSQAPDRFDLLHTEHVSICELPCDVSAPDWMPLGWQIWRGSAPQRSWTRCRSQWGRRQVLDCSWEPEITYTFYMIRFYMIRISSFIAKFWYIFYNTDLFIVKNTKLQANHGLCCIYQSTIGV